VIKSIKSYFLKPVHLAPLAVFRMAFGVLMLASVIRFMAKGWVYDMYIRPKLFFPIFLNLFILLHWPFLEWPLAF